MLYFSGRNSSNREQHPSSPLSQKQQFLPSSSPISSQSSATPPSLPPKTRKQLTLLQAVGGVTAAKCGKENSDQSEGRPSAVHTGANQSEARVTSHQNNNNISAVSSNSSVATTFKTSENIQNNEDFDVKNNINYSCAKPSNKVKINPLMGVSDESVKGPSTSVTSLGRSVSNVGHLSSRNLNFVVYSLSNIS